MLECSPESQEEGFFPRDQSDNIAWSCWCAGKGQRHPPIPSSSQGIYLIVIADKCFRPARFLFIRQEATPPVSLGSLGLTLILPD